jgi:tetratricopeptide (TPR) repeat protein
MAVKVTSGEGSSGGFNKDSIMESAAAHYDAGEWDAAIKASTEVIRVHPDYSFPALFLRGGAYSQKGDYGRAIADLKEAIQLDPNAAVVYNTRGIAYFNKKDYDRAIADLNEAIRLDPNVTDFYNNRGLVYLNKGNYDQGIVDLNEAIRLDPNYSAAYYNRYLAYGNKKVYDKALADIEMAVKLDPDNVEWREKLEIFKAEVVKKDPIPEIVRRIIGAVMVGFIGLQIGAFFSGFRPKIGFLIIGGIIGAASGFFTGRWLHSRRATSNIVVEAIQRIVGAVLLALILPEFGAYGGRSVFSTLCGVGIGWFLGPFLCSLVWSKLKKWFEKV